MDGWFFCEGYRTEMSLWHCIENQLSVFCLPHFPCHTCRAAVTIRPNTVETDPPSVGTDGGAPRRRPRRTIPPNMTRTVAKALGLM